jgi:hypothetical protein
MISRRLSYRKGRVNISNGFLVIPSWTSSFTHDFDENTAETGAKK